MNLPVYPVVSQEPMQAKWKQVLVPGTTGFSDGKGVAITTSKGQVELLMFPHYGCR